MEALGINSGYLLVQILNFIILFLVLKRWVYDPLLNVLTKRRQTIAEGLENARIAAEQRANAEEEAAKIITEAQAKAAEIVREATTRADASAQDIKSNAEAEAQKILELARVEAEKEKASVLEKMRPQIVSLAVTATQKLLGEALDEKRQHALLKEFFSGVKESKVVLLDEKEVLEGETEVISALPLTQEEQEVIRNDLLKKGSQSVNFRVDPGILGGLVIKAGSKLLDNSMAGKLDALRHELSN